MKYSRSKKLAWYMVIAGTVVTAYAIHQNMPTVASAILPASFTTAAAIYASKQWSDAKKTDSTQQNREGK